MIDVDYEPDKEDLIVLTESQEKFALLYVSRPDLTAGGCALEAGYTRSERAGELLKNPLIVARIKQLRVEFNKKFEVTFENHVAMLAHIRNEAMRAGNYGAAVTAETNRAKAAGLYVERKEILHGQIDQMSREDVMKEIEKLVKEYPALADSLTPKQIDVKPTEATDNEQETGE